MAVKRGAPFWLTWAFAGALALLFVGERVIGGGSGRAAVSGGAALVVVLATVWRLVSFLGSDGDRRRVERVLLLAQAGALVALAGYLLGSDDGMRWLGLRFAAPASRARWQDTLTVLWPVVLAVSLVPALLAQLAHGAARHAAGGSALVEAYRVTEAAAAGLTIAFAGAALFLFVYVAGERNPKVDVSYFRTSLPGSATRNMVGSLDEPLKVILFFPAVNEVKEEVRTYFEELQRATGKVEIEEHDRMAVPALARKYRAAKDATVVLVKGEQSDVIPLDPELNKARPTLRTFDERVQKAFLKVARGSRVAYLMTGHGELNDPASEVPAEAGGLTGAAAVKEMLAAMNYRVKDLGLASGSAQDVPADAGLVLVLGPRKPLLEEELAALDRYLERGGALLFALEPGSEAGLGPLERRLGVRFDPTPLVDEKVHVVMRENTSDRRLIATTQFSSHASVTTLGRARTGAGIMVPGAGALVDPPDLPRGAAAPRRTFVVRSLSSTFADANGNDEFDEGEKRSSYNLIAAIEGPAPPRAPEPAKADATATPAKDEPAKDPKDPQAPKDERPEEPRAMRALVVADSQLFSDAVLLNLQTNLLLAADALKWLGGDESFAGETISEKDVRIQHTKEKDKAWFYTTILGAPVLVLTAGLLGVFGRRRRGARRRAS